MDLTTALSHLANGSNDPQHWSVVMHETQRIARTFQRDALRAETSVDDVAQDVAIKLIEHARQGIAVGEPLVWTMTRNRVTDAARSQASRRRRAESLVQLNDGVAPHAYHDDALIEEVQLARISDAMLELLDDCAASAMQARRTAKEARSFWTAWRQVRAIAFDGETLYELLEQTTGVPRTDPRFKKLKTNAWQAHKRARVKLVEAAQRRLDAGELTAQQLQRVVLAVEAMKHATKSRKAS